MTSSQTPTDVDLRIGRLEKKLAKRERKLATAQQRTERVRTKLRKLRGERSANGKSKAA